MVDRVAELLEVGDHVGGEDVHGTGGAGDLVIVDNGLVVVDRVRDIVGERILDCTLPVRGIEITLILVSIFAPLVREGALDDRLRVLEPVPLAPHLIWRRVATRREGAVRRLGM